MSTGNRKKDIAVIGMSGVFPKSNNLIAFWNHLINGEELTYNYKVDEVGQDLYNTPNYIPVGSFVDNADSFDYKFFGYTKEEARLMDPQIRIMHEQVYAALDNAGYAHQIYKHNIGLYLSASDNLNWRLIEMFYQGGTVSKFLAQRLSNKDFISTLISYKLGLKGPSFYIDTACSTSLANIHLACRALLLKECNIAVSGGVSICSTEEKGYFFEDGLIASKDGHCRAFDEKASGTIWGEGAGAVVLKRFEDAIRDNDYIYAVVKATAVNNDGKRKVGYTAPSIEGQSDCIKMAHKIAGIQPETINYIEAHGTGTKLGDPIEIESLNKAFNYNKSHKCAVGSVKTNIGHLDVAAGVAGVIKTCLCLNYRGIPPSLHFRKANPEINFKDGPFYVNKTTQEWTNPEVFRAGVSSFGIGGTNCHAVLEEFKQDFSSIKQYPRNLVVFSAKTKRALENYKTNLALFLEQNKNCNLEQLSYSINTKVQNFAYRDFLVFENHEDILSQLSKTQHTVQGGNCGNIVFMFSGQGTQYYKMAKTLYDEIPYFKTIIDTGLRLLKELSGINFQDIIGYGDEHRDEHRDNDTGLINETLYAQPLLFLTEFALAKTLINFGVEPAGMIGHSLGEYVVACISKGFSFEDGLKIIWKRASLMNEMKPGSMVAIKARYDDISSFIENGLSVAAINTSDTCVLSGQTKDIEALAIQLDEKEISYAVLKTSHAFHSAMMDDMLEAYEQELNTIQFAEPQIPFISNLTGKVISSSEITASYWGKHLRNTVLFQKGLKKALEKWPVDDSVFIEIGPGRTLLNFLKKVSKKTGRTATMVSSRKEPKNDFKYLCEALGLLWKAGKKIDMDKLYPERTKMPVPCYAFDKTRLPSRVNPLKFIQHELNGNLDASQLLSSLSTGYLLEDKELDQASLAKESSDSFREDLTTGYLPPENEIQVKLCSIWRNFLGEEKIGIEDNFFELGGDSLKAMSILNTVKKEFNCEMKIEELYECQNIKAVSSKIAITTKLKHVSAKVSKRNKLII